MRIGEGLLVIVLVYLKLVGTITWSWFWILFPISCVPLAGIVTLICLATYGFLRG